MSGSVLFVKDPGLPREELQAILAHFAAEEDKRNQAFLSLLKGFMADAPAHLTSDGLLSEQLSSGPKAALALRPGLTWLSFFTEHLCDGNIVDSNDQLNAVSQAFHAPVLSFSAFDGDALFLSYCDAQNQVSYDYIKPNFDDFEEYDPEVYTSGFPDFLPALFGPEKREALMAVWNDDSFVFAEDRMEQLAQLLGLDLVDFMDPGPDHQILTGA